MKNRVVIFEGLSLYKQTETASWSFDININSRRVRKSTKKRDFDEAEAEARKWFSHIAKGGVISDIKHKRSLDSAISRAISFFEKKTTKTKDEYIVMLKEMFDKFRDLKSTSVNVDLIEKDILIKNSNTRRTMRKSCWKRVIEAALDLGMYDTTKPPRLPVIEKIDNEKEKISDDDLIKILSMKKQFIEAARNRISKENRELLFDYLKFIYLTGARAGDEVRELKFSDISDNYVKVKAGKIHSKKKSSYREVYLNKRAISLLKRRAEKLNIRFHKRHRSDCYIFCRADKKKPNFDTLFPQLIEFCKIEKGKYTAYSLRKNYITKQLEAGATVHAVAKQCGTSLAMINKHYDKSNIRHTSHNLK